MIDARNKCDFRTRNSHRNEHNSRDTVEQPSQDGKREDDSVTQQPQMAKDNRAHQPFPRSTRVSKSASRLNYSTIIQAAQSNSGSTNGDSYISNYYPPIGVPNLLLASSSALAAAAAAAAASGPTSGVGGGSYVASTGGLANLTPDARACVTATYLCVLIVNNAWLDCNLLEMLCNGTLSATNQRSTNSSLPQDRSSTRLNDMSRNQLKALEATLGELLRFPLNTRSNSEEEDPGGGANSYRSKPRIAAPLHDFDQSRAENQPMLLYNSSDGDVSKSSRFFDFLHRKSNNQEHDDTTISAAAAATITTQLPLPLQMTTSTTALSSQTINLPTNAVNYLVNWVGRPFRGWNFWLPSSDSIGGTESVAAIQQYQRDPSPQQQMQILRPIDRSEQYNDILTNQSGQKSAPQDLDLKEQSISADSQRNVPEESTPSQIALLAITDDLSSTPATVISSSTFSDLLSSMASDALSSTTRSDQGTPQSLPSPEANFGLHNQQQNQFNGQRPHQFQLNVPYRGFNIQCRCNDRLLSPPEVGDDDEDAGDPGEPDSGGECQYKCQQHQIRPQQQAPVTSVNILDPSQLMATDTNLSGLPSQPTPPATTNPSESSPTQGNIAQSSPGSSIMTTSASNLTPSGAKMNPLDVTFLLFTRYHRDLARELHQLSLETASQLATLNGVQSAGGGTTSAPSSSYSDLAGASELMDLTDETTLNESRLNSSLPIKIIIHGFGSGGKRPWVTDMVYKLLDYENVNVIVVDWEKGAALPNYVQAAGNTRLVGHKIACLIKSINAKYGLTGNSYHLIGFSLGAHVAGFAGMEIRNSTVNSRMRINRITGLDPASPLFEGHEANDRLDPTDAQFVDVIHSNGDGVLRGGFGSLQPMGHVDFYPNGGRVQVGCNSVLLSALSDIIYGKWQSLCNHRRALNFFMDSFEFSKCRFRSFNCDSYESYLRGDCFDCGQNNERCSYMGYLANYSKGRGKMYLTTHEDAPFCANQFFIKILGARGYKTHWGKVEVTLVTLNGKNESFILSSTNHQLNAGYDSGNGQKELVQHSMQSLIVAHPTLVNFTHVLLRYTKYKGWIYSGDESWSIDKLFIMDSDGQVKSFCGPNTILESHMTARLNLEPGNCTLVDQSSSSLPSGSPGQTQQQQAGQQVPHNSGEQQAHLQPHDTHNRRQQPQSQQSPRSPRLFASIIQKQKAITSTPTPNEHALTPGGYLEHHNLDQGHSLNRMTAQKRVMNYHQSHQQLAPNYGNMPPLAF